MTVVVEDGRYCCTGLGLDGVRGVQYAPDGIRVL